MRIDDTPISWPFSETPIHPGLYNNTHSGRYEVYNENLELIMFSKNTLPAGYLMYMLEEVKYAYIEDGDSDVEDVIHEFWNMGVVN